MGLGNLDCSKVHRTGTFLVAISLSSFQYSGSENHLKFSVEFLQGELGGFHKNNL